MLENSQVSRTLFAFGNAAAALSDAPAISSQNSIEGVGIHTGKKFRVHLKPNPSHNEIHFVYQQSDALLHAPAFWSRLSGTARATALVMRPQENSSRARTEIKTIEHFLAASLILGLRGVDVEIENLENSEVLELPILDGSAHAWMEWIGTFKNLLHPPKIFYKAIRSFEVTDGDRSVQIFAHADDSLIETHYTCSVSFPQIWQQESEFVMNWREPQKTAQDFFERIAPARTFGFEHELQELAKRGLGQGGALTNALLMSQSRVMNPEGFRVPMELASHKLLDLVGDFALIGTPIIGRLSAIKAGHSMHLRALTEAAKQGVFVKGTLDSQGKFQRLG